VKKADIRKKTHKPLTMKTRNVFRNNKVLAGHICYPTCFNFLKIPLTGQIGAKQTEAPER
jgi:hypothetical protein